MLVLLPPVVAKIGNTGYTTLQEAINKAKAAMLLPCKMI